MCLQKPLCAEVPSERVITPVQVWSGKHLINKLDPIRWNESYLLMPCSPCRSKAFLWRGAWGNPKGMKHKHAIRGAAKEWTTQNKTTHIKKKKKKRLEYVAMPEVMVFPGNTSCYFDKSLTLIFSGKVFVVVSYTVLSGLLWIVLN